ncbi:DUF4316 domain-containing protein [Flavonifractor plautii]|uniref:DUF4316 domain-containing protein n=1 Tax=Flavonifractor plautii TaxID=292800 RepID=UPI001D082C36|nr:DUF4316 domain-containing protein [Flavonifractor plautii]MCB7042305.1 DUF4316 domain-containing protein [Flavonifractor plautii]
MNKSDFFASMHTLVGCSPEISQKWIDFAAECVSNAERFAAQDSQNLRYGLAADETWKVNLERWLDSIYAEICAVYSQYGIEITRKLVAFSQSACYLGPGWMRPAALHLSQGESIVTIYDSLVLGDIPPAHPGFLVPLHPLTERDCAPDVGIRQKGLPCGYPKERIEPGYLLQDGTALLERERDATGCYIGGAGMDGIYLKTGQLYRPVYSDVGQLLAFRPVRPAPENYLATAEMDAEQNYNQIDGIINNEPPKPSLLDQLKQCQEAAGQQPNRPSHERPHDLER